MSKLDQPSKTGQLLNAVALGDSAAVGSLLTEPLQAHVFEGADLAQALGLDRPSRIRARNQALAEAAAVLAPGAASSWVIACRLAEAVERFSSRLWPRCSRFPEGLGPVDTALRIAHLSGERVPTTAKRLLPFTDTNATHRP